MQSIARKLYYASPPFAQRAARYFMPNERLFRKYLHELKKSQWFSPQQLEELQNRKLRQIIHHAYENVPYYRWVFDERGLKPKDIECKDDLKKLPILSKDEVQSGFDKFVAKNFRDYCPSLSETGGSTGKPLKFYNDKVCDVAERAFVGRYRRWAGYRPRHKQVVIRYKVDFPPTQEEFAPSHQVGNILYLSAFHLKGANLDDYINKISTFQPRSIYAFPSTLYVLAQHMIERSISPIPSLRCITTSSETLFPNFRKLIEEAFGAKIYDWYGSNERVVSAAECHNGNLHINVEYGVLEIVNSAGKAVPPGNIGLVVGTSLTKFAMPLIRYELGDRAILSDNQCPCGRGLPLIASLEGRLDDLIVTKDGCFVGRLDEAFHESFGIKMSQIVQEEIGKITVRIVKGQTYSGEDVKRLDVELRKRLGKDMRIKYEFVDDVERVGRGKYRFVISKLDVGKLYRD